MKKHSSTLGELGSKFFALTQMNNITTVSLGDIQGPLHISPQQEKQLLQRLANQGYILRLMKGLYLVPEKLPPGGHWNPSEYYIVDTYMGLLKASYYVGGPIAFHHYGFVQQIPNVTTVYNDKVSGEKKIGHQQFQFIKISARRIDGHNEIELPDNQKVNFSSLPRALVDAVYDWHRFNTLPKAYSWISKAVNDPLILKALVTCTLNFTNIATVRRIGYILERFGANQKMLNSLEYTLKQTSAWIPLNPNAKNQGKTNKTWRIIDNVYPK